MSFRYVKRWRWISVLSMVVIGVYADPALMSVQQTEMVLSARYRALEHAALSMPERIVAISAGFLGKPYVLGPLGEGRRGRYDQYPLYRVDAFDCLTFVETVLALAFADNLDSFRHCMDKIRYHQGRVDFLMRNHFTDLDWNQNNEAQGFIRDITKTIHNKQQQSVAILAKATIDKATWYQRLRLSRVRVIPSNIQLQQRRLAELKEKGRRFAPVDVAVPYIPLTTLFDVHGNPNWDLFQQIPHGAIIEIVRPGWDLRPTIGTQLNISHLGFAIWRHNTLYFRNASTLKGKVVDYPLADYLHDVLSSPTIKGISVYDVIIKHPGTCEN